MELARNPGRGLRRHTEHTAQADRFAADFRGLERGVTPSMALGAVKRAARFIGLSPGPVMILDTLLAHTKPQDWLPGRTPYVWPRNEDLATRHAITVRQVQKHLKTLERFGLVTHRDSPNGHRGGRRGPDKHIIWAYGINLAPIGTRYAEMLAVARDGEGLEKSVRIKRTTLRAECRKIRTLAQQAFEQARAEGEAQDALALASLAVDQLGSGHDPDLIQRAVMQLVAQRERLEQALDTAAWARETELSEAAEMQDSSCKGEPQDTHSTTAIQLPPATAGTSESCGSFSDGGSSTRTPRNRATAFVADDLERHGITPAFLFDISPDLNAELSTAPYGWLSIHAAADRLRRQRGVSAGAWNAACDTMGPDGAAAAVISIARKHDLGAVRSPGAYLRGMTAKARAGGLQLGRTLYGLRDAKDAGETATPPEPGPANSIGHLAARQLDALRAMSGRQGV